MRFDSSDASLASSSIDFSSAIFVLESRISGASLPCCASAWPDEEGASDTSTGSPLRDVNLKSLISIEFSTVYLPEETIGC